MRGAAVQWHCMVTPRMEILSRTLGEAIYWLTRVRVVSYRSVLKTRRSPEHW
jgi:hypothetical protein